MGVRVQLMWMGEEPIKVSDTPIIWLRKGDLYAPERDQAEFLVQKHKTWKVIRDPHGVIHPDGVTPSAQQASGPTVEEINKLKREKAKAESHTATDKGGVKK